MKTKILLLLFPVIFLSGCYDQKEIDETAYIVALGIDKGENNNFSYTFQFSAPLAMTGGETESGEKSASSSQSEENSSVTTLTIAAPDFYVAKNLTNNFLSKNVDMSHLKFIVFSSEVGADDLESHSQLLLREREIRPHTSIAVSANRASEFLENVNPELESNTSKYYELMSLRSNNVYSPPKRLHDFVDEYTAKNRDTVLPVGISGKKIKDFPPDSQTPGWISAYDTNINSDHSVLSGMAIFKNGALSGSMNGDSSLIFNLLERNIKNCTITVVDKYNPEKTLSFRLTIPRKANFEIQKDNGKITVSQSFETDFMGNVLPKGYRSYDELYSHAEKILSERISNYFLDISRTKSADIMNLRNYIRKDFLTWDEWDRYDWDKFYKTANFVVNISVLRRN